MTTLTGSTIEHAIGPNGLLAIQLRDGELRIRGIDGDVATVRDANDHDLDEMFEIEAADGSLSLRSRRGADFLRDWIGLEGGIGEWIGLEGDWLGLGIGDRPRRERHRARHRRRGGGGHTPELLVEVPNRAGLIIESTSADLDVEGLLGDQRYRTTSGEITLRGVSGKLAIESVSGDVDVVMTGTSELSVRTVSGDLEVRGATLSSVQAATTSGDLRIAGRFAGNGPFTIETVSGDGLLAPAGDVQIQMTSLTGDLNSEFDEPTVRHGRRSLTIGRSGPLVTFRSMSGDLHVVRPVATSAHAATAMAQTTAGISQVTTTATASGGDAGSGAIAAAYEDARLRILRSLERGEIDVAEASRQLATLDNGEPLGRPEATDA
jgi:hypothetical protein